MVTARENKRLFQTVMEEKHREDYQKLELEKNQMHMIKIYGVGIGIFALKR